MSETKLKKEFKEEVDSVYEPQTNGEMAKKYLSKR